MDDAITKKSRFWEVTDGIVTIPYTEGNFLTHEERTKIQLAIAEYNSKTCIRLVILISIDTAVLDVIKLQNYFF